jgi:transcriptional regulator with XRE-family HTH domain
MPLNYDICYYGNIWILPMLSLFTAFDVQIELKDYLKQSRKQHKLSVERLAEQSGVPYGTIRKFENSGSISLRQFLMLLEVLGGLKHLRELYKERELEPASIDEVLKNA